MFWLGTARTNFKLNIENSSENTNNSRKIHRYRGQNKYAPGVENRRASVAIHVKPQIRRQEACARRRTRREANVTHRKPSSSKDYSVLKNTLEKRCVVGVASRSPTVNQQERAPHEARGNFVLLVAHDSVALTLHNVNISRRIAN